MFEGDTDSKITEILHSHYFFYFPFLVKPQRFWILSILYFANCREIKQCDDFLFESVKIHYHASSNRKGFLTHEWQTTPRKKKVSNPMNFTNDLWSFEYIQNITNSQNAQKHCSLKYQIAITVINSHSNSDDTRLGKELTMSMIPMKESNNPRPHSSLKIRLYLFYYSST